MREWIWYCPLCKGRGKKPIARSKARRSGNAHIKNFHKASYGTVQVITKKVKEVTKYGGLCDEGRVR